MSRGLIRVVHNVSQTAQGSGIVAGYVGKLSRDANNTQTIIANNGFRLGHNCQVVKYANRTGQSGIASDHLSVNACMQPSQMTFAWLEVHVIGLRYTLTLFLIYSGWLKNRHRHTFCRAYALTSSYIDRFSNLFHCLNQGNICNR